MCLESDRGIAAIENQGIALRLNQLVHVEAIDLHAAVFSNSDLVLFSGTGNNTSSLTGKRDINCLLRDIQRSASQLDNLNEVLVRTRLDAAKLFFLFVGIVVGTQTLALNLIDLTSQSVRKTRDLSRGDFLDFELAFLGDGKLVRNTLDVVGFCTFGQSNQLLLQRGREVLS